MVIYINQIDSPIEGDIYYALSRYRMALVNANYRSLQHKVLCFIRNEEALRKEIDLANAKNRIKHIASQSPVHNYMFHYIITVHPEFSREKHDIETFLRKNIK
jgi:hypothetical protein